MEESLIKDYKLLAFQERLKVHAKISESAQNYIRTLFGFQDNRENRVHGIDLRDISFSPYLYFEAKEGLDKIQIYDTQLHYQNNDSRSYLIMVQRIDDIKTYYYVLEKGKKRKRLKYITNEESLLLNFGNILILPLEVVEEHYIAQRTKNIVAYRIDEVGRGKRFNSSHNLSTKVREKVRKELEEIKSRRNLEESVRHDERIKIDFSFSQASQIINENGSHYDLIRKSKTFFRGYRHNMIRGPLLYPSSDQPSYIYLMDVDDIVMNHLLSRISVQEINEIKRQRFESYEEIKKLRKIGFKHEGDKKHINLENILDSLVNWRLYGEDLFSHLEREEQAF